MNSATVSDRRERLEIEQIPIPFINRIFGRPMTTDYRSNCLFGDHPNHHKIREAAGNSAGWADGDTHPSMRFSWRPPENLKKLLLDPGTKLADLWAISSPKQKNNKYICHCKVEGTVIDFTRIVLAPRRKSPKDPLNMVSIEEAKEYLHLIAENADQYRRFMWMLPDQVPSDINFSQHSGLYHIARYVGCKNAAEVPECFEMMIKTMGIDSPTLSQLDIGYVANEKAFKEAFTKDYRYKNQNELISAGLFNAQGQPAFSQGTVIFPFKRSGSIVYLYGWRHPVPQELFNQAPCPLFNENVILASNGLKPIIVCDNLADTLKFHSLGYLTVGVPWCTSFHSGHAEPFKEAQTILKRIKNLEVILAFNSWTYHFDSSKSFIGPLERLQESGLKIKRLRLPHGIRTVNQYLVDAPAQLECSIHLENQMLLETRNAK